MLVPKARSPLPLPNPRAGLGEPKNQAPFTVKLKPTPGKTPKPSSSVTGAKPKAALPPPSPKPAAPPVLTPEQQAQQAVQQALAPQYTSQASDAAARNKALQDFTIALMQQISGMPQQTAGIYDQAISGQNSLAQGAADALRGANPNQQDQQMLQFLGAPQGQQDLTAGLLNNAFNGGAAVGLYSNALDSGALQAQKLSAVSQLAGLPAIEGLRGQQGLATALQQEAQQKAAIDAQAPDLVQKYLSQYQTAQANAAAAHKPNIFGSGSTGYFALDPATGKITRLTSGATGASKPPVTFSGPGGARYAWSQNKDGTWSTQLVVPGQSPTAKPPKTVSGPDGLYSWQQTKGGWQLVPVGPRKAVKAGGRGGSSHYQSRTVNGHTVVFDPSTGTYLDPGTGTPINPNTLSKPPVALTPKVQRTIIAGISPARAGYYGIAGTGGARKLPTPVSDSSLAKVAAKDKMTLEQLRQNPKALAKAGIVPVHVTDNGKQDPLINKIYLEVIDHFGISRDQAFQQIGRVFPGWARRNRSSFFPKGSASQGGATKGASYTPTSFANPVPNASFERVDQGVDYMARTPVRALGAGTVVSIGKGMAGGTGDIIKVRLDKPVTVNGRTYHYVYYSEEKPLVGQGAHVNAGQSIMGAGGDEIGFLNNDMSFPPLLGGLGAGTKGTQQGADFLAFVKSLSAGRTA